jgi:hypothetical protein
MCCFCFLTAGFFEVKNPAVKQHIPFLNKPKPKKEGEKCDFFLIRFLKNFLPSLPLNIDSIKPKFP